MADANLACEFAPGPSGVSRETPLGPGAKKDSCFRRLMQIRGVCIADETLTRVFDISSQSKLKQRSERRNKIIKIYAMQVVIFFALT